MRDKNEVSKALKRFLQNNNLGHLRIRGGKGTAYGWIEVWAHDLGGMFTPEEIQKLKDLNLNPGGNCVLKTIEEWEMFLGLERKRPLCPICGTIYATQEFANECIITH